MNTDKKIQHFVPKFYLRNFSYNMNGNQIGIFNTKSSFFLKDGKLKTQASKNFFYGHDGKIEERLSKLEGYLAIGIKKMLDSILLPRPNSREHLDLLSFVALMHLRNPSIIEYAKTSRKELQKKTKELYPKYDFKDLIPELNHESAVKLTLSNINVGIKNCQDLNYKFLINCSDKPFITSDNPIIKYNKFLEEKKWIHGKTGYGNIGLQIIIPLNPRIGIIFYDSLVYKVGFKKRNYVIIDQEKDVDQLNILQFLNCSDMIYFNEEAHKNYLYRLFYRSKNYKKANKIITKVYKSKWRDGNYIGLSITDCEIKLNIKGIKKSSRAAGIRLTKSIAQLRTLPSEIYSKEH